MQKKIIHVVRQADISEIITKEEIQAFRDRLKVGQRILVPYIWAEGVILKRTAVIVDKYDKTLLMEYDTPSGRLRMSPSYTQLMLLIGRNYGKRKHCRQGT